MSGVEYRRRNASRWELYSRRQSAMVSYVGSSFAVFVSSTDTRRDVLDLVLLSLQKFWPDRPYPLYVGLNTITRPLSLGTPLLATRSAWHQECLQQLAQLPEVYLIVMLDDFLLRKHVDQ